MKRKALLVVEADDLGLAREFNAGIREAAAGGVLSSACALMNGPAIEETVREVVPECPGLGIGIHLNIVEGSTTRRSVPRSSLLCTSDGCYRMSFPRLFRMRNDPRLLDEIERDYRDQIERGLRYFPHADHINSHQHSHAVPTVFELVCRLALEYGIPYVRLPRERPYYSGPLLPHVRPRHATNLTKVLLLNHMARTNHRTAREMGVATNAWLLGVGYTGLMTAERLLAGLGPHREETGGVVEALFHPARSGDVESSAYFDASVRRYARDPARVRELQALLDPTLLSRLNDAGWEVTNYSRLRSGAGSRAGEALET